MLWRPNVTVAAVIQHDNKFLLVEEQTDEGLKLNQPAGHLEPGESLIDGAIRETMEETAYQFIPQQLLGVYRWHKPGSDIAYLRFAFVGQAGTHDSERRLDAGIARVLWLSADEIRESLPRHRSPLVARCIEDYLGGKGFPLNMITDCE